MAKTTLVKVDVRGIKGVRGLVWELGELLAWLNGDQADLGDDEDVADAAALRLNNAMARFNISIDEATRE